MYAPAFGTLTKNKTPIIRLVNLPQLKSSVYDIDNDRVLLDREFTEEYPSRYQNIAIREFMRSTGHPKRTNRVERLLNHYGWDSIGRGKALCMEEKIADIATAIVEDSVNCFGKMEQAMLKFSLDKYDTANAIPWNEVVKAYRYFTKKPRARSMVNILYWLRENGYAVEKRL